MAAVVRSPCLSYRRDSKNARRPEPSARTITARLYAVAAYPIRTSDERYLKGERKTAPWRIQRGFPLKIILLMDRPVVPRDLFCLFVLCWTYFLRRQALQLNCGLSRRRGVFEVVVGTPSDMSENRGRMHAVLGGVPPSIVQRSKISHYIWRFGVGDVVPPSLRRS
jgi:hypothetical protein